MKTALARKMRHPMLIGMVLWCVAHLLVNGDVPELRAVWRARLWAGRDRAD
ncbi:MAG: NnrU family protein [Paracoccaceae bacterium]